MRTSSTNNSVFKGFFEKEKLIGPNFIDWYRQLRIVLSIEDKLKYLEQPIPPVLVAPAEIQLNLEPLPAHKMLKELKTLFAQQAEHELLQTTRDFHSCRQEEGQMRKTVNELHAMLKLHEQTMPKSNALALNAIRAEIVLNNCHYAPSITRGVTSVSRLYEDGFVNNFIDNTIQVSRNNVVYFYAIPRDSIFEIDLSNSLTNESFVYAVSNKRAKLDLDSALLWHCRLGYISKKRIEKLQHDGLLNSSDLTAFEKYIRAIRILIAIAAYYDYEIWQMDVKTAFLNGYLNEEVYMEKPKGFVNLKYPNHVCKLKRSIYGLKQASSGSNVTYLGKCFAMKDLEKILKRYCMENSKCGSIHMQEKLKLSKSQDASTPAEMKRMQNVPYASAVGSIMNTKDMFLVYEGDLKRELRVSCHTDAGYLTDAVDLKSQTGYVFILNGGVVDWKSAKQCIFSTSSAEAEYIAAFDASKEAV
nr:hypothetical protein [Tanacetum cinerariifolium]